MKRFTHNFQVQNLLIKSMNWDRHHLQLAMLILILIFFVLTGGAPEGGGGCSDC